MHWRLVPREFVVSALIGARLGRTCRGIEGPVAGAAAPWTSRGQSWRAPPSMSRRGVERLAVDCLEKLLRHDAVDLPERGTDAYRFGVELGSLVWQREHAARLAAAYVGVTQAPAVLVWAAGLHAMLRHPVEVEASGVRVRGADLRGSEELWAQWCEWLHCDAPAGFVRWVHPEGLYRASDMLEPREGSVPDLEACRAVERALVEDAERNARYVPYGAFVVELPEELFLRAWGVERLWLWVEGKRVWCAVDGGGGPRESFCWEAGRGVLTNLVAPLDVSPAMGAVLAAVWRDMAVAGEEAVPRRSERAAGGEGIRRPLQFPRPQQGGAPVAVFPRRAAARLEMSGERSWGSEEDRRAVRRAHSVRGHLRRLAGRRRPSERARAAAGEWGVVLPEGYTFVRPHVRGRQDSFRGETEQRVKVVARGLRTVAALLAPGGGGERPL